MPGIEKAIVHVNVEHQCTISHLLACNSKRFSIVFLADKPQELSRTGNITSFADIGERTWREHIEP